MLFPTQEIGSLPKPSGLKGNQASLFNIQFLEDMGLDYVYDGEAQRIEMYEYPARYVDGMKIQDWIRSWDNKYYRKASCVDKLKLKEPYYLKEFEFVKSIARHKIKVPFTGPYTMMDWSYSERYSRETLAIDFAKKIVRPNLEALVNAGAQWIQIDEPAATTKPHEVPLFVESFNEAVKGLDCKISTHICYSDYSLLYPDIMNMMACHLAFEYANKNNYDEIFKLFKEYGDTREIGLGVLDVHSDNIETPEVVRDRILHAHNSLPNNTIYVNPDCGLRTRRHEIVKRKLQNMVKGTKMARKEVLKYI